MQTFFGASGPLAAVLAGFEPRPQQGELAAAIADALEAGEHLLAEAGTGTGKSLAYLVPALALRSACGRSNSDESTPGPVVDQGRPGGRPRSRTGRRCAVLKGRQNYLCRKSLHGLELLGGSGLALFRTEADAGEYERLREWVEATQTGDRAELAFEPSASLWADLAVGADRCQGKRCPLVGSCYSEAARERAGEAELVIVNHALYFADLALRVPERRHRRPSRPRRCHLRRGPQARGGRLGLVRRPRLRGTAAPARARCRAFVPRGGEGPPARPLAALDRMGSSFIAALEPAGGRTRLRAPALDPFLDQAFALGEALEELAQALAGGGEEAEGLRRRALDTADDLDACLVVDDPERVSWAEAGAVAWAPVEVSDLLRDELWDRPVTSVLVSATLGRTLRTGPVGAREPALARRGVSLRVSRAGARLRPGAPPRASGPRLRRAPRGRGRRPSVVSRRGVRSF